MASICDHAAWPDSTDDYLLLKNQVPLAYVPRSKGQQAFALLSGALSQRRSPNPAAVSSHGNLSLPLKSSNSSSSSSTCCTSSEGSRSNSMSGDHDIKSPEITTDEPNPPCQYGWTCCLTARHRSDTLVLSSGIHEKDARKQVKNPARLRMLAAVRANDAPTVIALMAEDAATPLLMEAFCLAVDAGSVQVVRELVATGIDVNHLCPTTGYSPLHVACAAGNSDLCEMLLDARADVHKEAARDDAFTPFELAKQCRDKQVHTMIVSFTLDSALKPDPCLGRVRLLPRAPPAFFKSLQAKFKSLSAGFDDSSSQPSTAATCKDTDTNCTPEKVALPMSRLTETVDPDNRQKDDQNPGSLPDEYHADATITI